MGPSSDEYARTADTTPMGGARRLALARGDRDGRPAIVCVDRTCCAAVVSSSWCGRLPRAEPVTQFDPDRWLAEVLAFPRPQDFGSSTTESSPFTTLGRSNRLAFDATQDSHRFTGSNLAQHHSVIWLSTTGDILITVVV